MTTHHEEPATASKLAFRVDEACYALGIGRTSLYELAKTGQIRLIKIAGRTLVPRSEIERLTRVDERSARGPATPGPTPDQKKSLKRRRALPPWCG